MKKNIRHSINDYRMPLYMQEILVKNYCPHFLRMSILREGDGRWMFSYDTDDFKIINPDSMDSLDKLTLIQTLMKIRDSCEEWLIKSDTYMIEPNLIYCRNGVSMDRVRLMFYPDYDGNSFSVKMINLIDFIKNRRNKIESDILEQIKASIRAEEGIKTRQMIERNIMRIKIDDNYKVG